MAERTAYVSLVWRPWSLALLDPARRMLELTFEYVRRRGLCPAMFARPDEKSDAAPRA